ncbi:MAG: Bug family tripartite tricarboxylate transporter substrate binding protein [Burkholderiales bacterium]
MNYRCPIALMILAMALAGAVAAQSFPNRPIRIVQGSAAGGNADTAARLLGQGMQKSLGQAIIVETRLGGAGRIAADAVARAAPDGHTLLLITGGHVTTGAASKSLPYDTVDSFAWISMASEFPFMLVVRADSPFQTLASVIAEARAKPQTVTFGSSGTGATLHLVGELVGRMANVELVHVPYKGESQAMIAILAGDIRFAVATPTTAVGQVNGGKVKALAVSSATRWPGMPDVPTIAEAGVPGYDVRSWLGLATTGGTPRPIVDRLHEAMMVALKDPEVTSRLEAMGGTVRSSTPDETRQRVVSELARWNKVITEANIPRE